MKQWIFFYDYDLAGKLCKVLGSDCSVQVDGRWHLDRTRAYASGACSARNHSAYAIIKAPDFKTALDKACSESIKNSKQFFVIKHKH